MRKSRFTEAQIIGMLKEQEAGLPTSELCRKHGLSPATFYKLKAKYGGMDLSDAKRLKRIKQVGLGVLHALNPNCRSEILWRGETGRTLDNCESRIAHPGTTRVTAFMPIGTTSLNDALRS